MEVYAKIYKVMINLYPNAFPRQPDETVWVIADSVDSAMSRLRSEYQHITTSGISPVFGCVLAVDNFDYCAEVYEIDLILRNGTDTTIHVLADNISAAMILYAQLYEGVIKSNIKTLTGTVFPKKKGM